MPHSRSSSPSRESRAHPARPRSVTDAQNPPRPSAPVGCPLLGRPLVRRRAGAGVLRGQDPPRARRAVQPLPFGRREGPERRPAARQPRGSSQGRGLGGGHRPRQGGRKPACRCDRPRRGRRRDAARREVARSGDRRLPGVGRDGRPAAPGRGGRRVPTPSRRSTWSRAAGSGRSCRPPSGRCRRPPTPDGRGIGSIGSSAEGSTSMGCTPRRRPIGGP